MIHGIFFIHVAPFMSKYIDTSRNKKLYIVMSGVLGSLAFLTFYLLGGFSAALVAVFLLGLAGSVNASHAYALELKISQAMGGGKTMSILATIDRIGQVLGPMVFGWLLMTTRINQGITHLGLSFLGLTILFFLLARGFRKKSVSGNQQAS